MLKSRKRRYPIRITKNIRIIELSELLITGLNRGKIKPDNRRSIVLQFPTGQGNKIYFTRLQYKQKTDDPKKRNLRTTCCTAEHCVNT